MKDLTFKMWCKAQFARQQVSERFTSEEGDASGIIIAIIMIIIVVALAIVFRDQIGNWFNKLVGQADPMMDGLDQTPANAIGG